MELLLNLQIIYGGLACAGPCRTVILRFVATVTHSLPISLLHPPNFNTLNFVNGEIVMKAVERSGFWYHQAAIIPA
jgi:hypothetical protein